MRDQLDDILDVYRNPSGVPIELQWMAGEIRHLRAELAEYRDAAKRDLERVTNYAAEIKAQRPGLVDAVVAQQKRAEEAEAAIARVRGLRMQASAEEWDAEDILSALDGES